MIDGEDDDAHGPWPALAPLFISPLPSTLPLNPKFRSRRRAEAPEPSAPPKSPCSLTEAEMDTSVPSPFVNGETLKMFVGRRVRTVVQVQRNESGVLAVQSTDGHQLTIRGAPDAPEAPHYIEVMGIPDSNQSIRAESWTDFGENFDIVPFNGLCKLANDKYKYLFL
uniref:Uncharacterized protein n=1 Tax=Avena sativa TaxID=4498 RepID=A0ACD5VDG0_AVESA